MSKKITQYIKNPKFGQGSEPEWLEVPQMVSNNGEVLSRLLAVEKLEYNATQVTNNGYDGLSNALASVTDEKYKVRGIVLTWYDTTETKWKSMRYNGTDSAGWATTSNWVEAGGGGISESDFYFNDFLMNLNDGDTVTKEQYDELMSAIKSGKIIAMKIANESSAAYLLFLHSLTDNSDMIFYANMGPNVVAIIISSDYTVKVYEEELLGDAPKDGKQYVRQDGTWVEASGGGEPYVLNEKFYSLTESSSSQEISDAIGGREGFVNMVKAARANKDFLIKGKLGLMDIHTKLTAPCSQGDIENVDTLLLMMFGIGYLLWGGAGGVLSLQYKTDTQEFSITIAPIMK